MLCSYLRVHTHPPWVTYSLERRPHFHYSYSRSRRPLLLTLQRLHNTIRVVTYPPSHLALRLCYEWYRPRLGVAIESADVFDLRFLQALRLALLCSSADTDSLLLAVSCGARPHENAIQCADIRYVISWALAYYDYNILKYKIQL